MPNVLGKILRRRGTGKVFRELSSIKGGVDDYVETVPATLSRFLKSRLFLSYLESLFKLVRDRYGEELEECVRETSRCGGVGFLVCAFAIVNNHSSEMEAELMKMSRIMKAEAESLGFHEAVREAYNHKRDLRLVNELIKEFSRRCENR